MAKLVKSSDVFIGSNINIESSHIEFNGGRNLGPLPTLYDGQGHYVEPANQWFIHLAAERRLEDLSSYSRALLRYWSFLDKYEDLGWDKFPPVKSLKPTYRFRNQDLLENAKAGNIAYSTANTYINHVVKFYLWAASEGYYPITKSNKPFEIEFVLVKNNSMLAHMMPKFTVQTSDLRIRVPRDAVSGKIRSMNPLSADSLSALSLQLRETSPEIRSIVLLGVQCGLRIEEATGMTLDALNQAVLCPDSKDRYELTIGPCNGVPTKNNKTRTIEISEQLLRNLRRYAIDQRRIHRLNKLLKRIEHFRSIFPEKNRPSLHPLGLTKNKLDALIAADRHEPLFISQQGNPVTPNVANTRFGEMRKAIQKTQSTFNHHYHDLRCTYGTYRLRSLLDAGVDPGDALILLMGWMGHENESTTWLYLRYLKRKEALKEKISILDDIMHQALEGSDNE